MKVEQQLKVTDQATIRTGVHSLDAEIALVEVQQKQAIANLDLDIEIERARQKANIALTSLDKADKSTV